MTMQEFNNEKGYQEIAHSPDEQNCSSVHSEPDQIESQSAIHLSIIDVGGEKEDCKTDDLVIEGGEIKLLSLPVLADQLELLKLLNKILLNQT